MRSTEQRFGDITLVLVGFAALVLMSRLFVVIDESKGMGSSFWVSFGLYLEDGVVPAFAASCTFAWMDAARRRYARWAIVVVFACDAGAILASLALGRNATADLRTADLFEQAALLLVIAGGLTLVAGLRSTRVPVETGADA